MNAASLAKFEQAAQAYDKAVTPMTVSIGGQPYEAAGSLTDERVVETRAGGVAIQIEAHFTLAKSEIEGKPALGDLVQIDGKEFEITRVSGLDAYDPNWSIRAERWWNK